MSMTNLWIPVNYYGTNSRIKIHIVILKCKSGQKTPVED